VTVRKTTKTTKIRGLAQVRALAHPLRLRLLELFIEQPRTTKQAAQALGESPTKLYHHVAALEQAGLVRLRETRQNRGTTEKYFEAVARRYEAAPEIAGQLTGSDRAAIGMVLFDQAREELVRALAAAGDELPEMMAIRGLLRLSPRGAKLLKKELAAVLARVKASEAEAPESSRRARKHYSLTIALLPREKE
jgi:DNA-binding transcriptional ArsR family regulator